MRSIACALILLGSINLHAAPIAEAGCPLTTDGDYTGQVWIGVNCSGRDLKGLILDGSDISGGLFIGSTFETKSAEGVRLDRAVFDNASVFIDRMGGEPSFVDTRFVGAKVSFGDAKYADFSGAVFDNAIIGSDGFDGANFTAARFVNATVFGFMGGEAGAATVTDADFRGADLSQMSNSFSSEFDPDVFFMIGSAIYNNRTLMPSYDDGVLFDPVAAGWRFVPEPGTGWLFSSALLIAFGVHLFSTSVSRPARRRPRPQSDLGR